jgi:toxin secretion/phage lysis holin
MNNKNIAMIIISAIGGLVMEFLGGIDALLVALIVFMAVDYLTGLAVAIVFHKSKKTAGGGASSKEGFKGIVKKVCILLLIGLAHEVDVIVGADYIRAVTIMFFIANEGLSVLENLGLMDIKYPAFLTRALEILKDKAEGEGNDKTGTD